jgi:hypothetical protein
MAAIERGQAEMLSLVNNVNQRKANNDWPFVAYFISYYNSFPDTLFQNHIILVFKERKD